MIPKILVFEPMTRVPLLLWTNSELIWFCISYALFNLTDSIFFSFPTQSSSLFSFESYIFFFLPPLSAIFACCTLLIIFWLWDSPILVLSAFIFSFSFSILIIAYFVSLGKGFFNWLLAASVKSLKFGFILLNMI